MAELYLVMPEKGEPDSSEALRNIGALESAEDRAFRRGQAAAVLKGTVEAHEKRLNAINGSIDRLAHAVGDLKGAFERSLAVTQARAEDAKTAAEKQVSTRTFILGLIGAVVAIGTLLAATGHG